MTSDLAVELYTGATTGWVAPSVYTRSSVQISRGVANESTSATPTTCTCQIDNRSGAWDPRNPIGPYYGQIGRNTPMRLSLVTITDTFHRTVSSGWGSAPDGQNWSTFGSGGSAADFAVNGSAATHSIGSTSSYRLSALAESYLDVDVQVDVSVLPSTNVTGGQIEPANILLRYQNSANYYMARATIATDQSVSIALYYVDGSVIAAPVTVAGLTHGNNVLRVRAQAEGQSLRAKVWDASKPEPYDWQVTTNYVTAGATQINTAGQIGVRSGVASGNTNTSPVVFSYTNFVVRVPRFAGEVGQFEQGADQSNQDRWVNVDAAGVLRRLGQGNSPLQSTLRRSIPSLTTLVAYWPCEDGSQSVSFANALGGPAMAYAGAIQLANDASSFACSAPLPTLGSTGALSASVPLYAATGAAQVRWLMAFPGSGVADQTVIARIKYAGFAANAVAQAELRYGTGGSLRLLCQDINGTTLVDSGAISFNVDGTHVRVSVELSQQGSSVKWQFSTYAIFAPLAGFVNGTFTGTVYAATGLDLVPDGGMNGAVIGHITVENAVTDLFALAAQFNAYDGEAAATRMARLCTENSITFDQLLDPTGSARDALMGPQLVGKLVDLLNDCATADMGLLSESRGTVGLLYISLGAHYSQAATLTLDVTAKQLAAPPQPVDDDQQTHNDVIATRTNGSSARSTLTTGRLSTLPPSQGGIGVYDEAVTVNVHTDSQLPDIASWLLHLGTYDAARYPQLPLRFVRPPSSANRAQYLAALAVTMPNKVILRHLTADDILVLVRGYTETISMGTPGLLTLALNGVPGAPYEIAVFDDGGASRWDSDTSTLHAVIGTTTTSFQVDTGTGGLWTTSAGDFPFDVTMTGERMTVTNITGTTSPQTFTVTRSINGVAKTHTAGEKISLFSPVYFGLGR